MPTPPRLIRATWATMASLTDDFSPRLLIVGNRMMRFLATFGPREIGENRSDIMA